jgi:LuxR family maltose regulon positive regulatory protein
MGTVIETLTLRALALYALGQGGEAAQSLGRALQLAEPERVARVFLDQGQAIAVLLRQAAAAGFVPGYANRLLAAYGEKEGRRREVDMSALIEPLSDRELEVLGLIATGLTNPEIAQQLVISLPTVKSHTRNLYGKLGVHSRKQAVQRAKALGILF